MNSIINRFLKDPISELAGNVEKSNIDAEAIKEQDKERKEKAKNIGQAIVPDPEPFDAPRFDVEEQLEEAVTYLDQFGYVVISGIISKEDLSKAESMFWEFLENNPKIKIGTQIDRKNVATWGPPLTLTCPVTGIISSNGIGQSDFMWFLRTLPGVKKTFARIWGTDSLLTSFDGCGMFLPHQFKEVWRTVGGWYHVDQNGSNKPNKICIQGLLSLYDQNASTGGLCVISESHQHFKELSDRVAYYHHGDFVNVGNNDPLLQVPGKMVCCKAGDLILWDSRTIHCNSPNLQPPPPLDMENPKPLRTVAYICMTPKSLANEYILQRRREAYEEHCTTSHWPHEFHPVTHCSSKPKNCLKSAPIERLELIC